MTLPLASHSPRGKESHALLVTVISIALIALCLWAAQWQYHRGVDRHHRNTMIASHTDMTPTALDSIAGDLAAAEWRRVRVAGTFDSSHQILLRNRYNDGKYGFDLLTLFTDTQDRTYWIDRGWIAPGENARLAPDLPPTSEEQVSILGRIRLNQSLPQGSFFAISARGKNLIEQWNAQSKSKVATENFYLDLLASSDESMTPTAPVELPELTDGPHMAYALQWLFFGGLVVYGRLLLRRAR